ncbi:MAG TPA: hypothetical protein VGW38_07145 [Chloroflexota bacterium]|nr:hypothetical protein [Chloroflexota bacterium]
MPKRVTKGNLWGFIQSRPYVSVADIRRLFLMEVEDASTVRTDEGNCFIGLPQPVADIVGQLWHEGRVVLDFNPDVKARVVQGLYPSRLPSQRTRTADSTGGGPPAEELQRTGKRKRKRRRKPSGGAQAEETSQPGAAEYDET